jgi:MFS transporter, CP family, cyanate transporter
MPALVAGIHDFAAVQPRKAWMAGTSPAMTYRIFVHSSVTERYLLHIFLLWLAGNALRMTILAVPPVIPQIHHDLNLSATGVGILGGLPVVLFAAAAMPGALLIARLGPVRALVVGLLFAAIGGALRGAIMSVAWLYAMTIVMAAGVAVMQPALPALVRLWTPQRAAFATAVYSNGLLVGETLPVLFMLPVVLPLLHGSWPLGLAFWSLPMLAITAVVVIVTMREDSKAPAVARPKWWPDWRNGLIWRLGLSFGSVNAMYFGSNTFLPDYLAHHGRADLISAALSALNFGQLPASILLLVLASRLERRVWPFVAFGLLCLAAVIGIATTASGWTVAWAALLGFAAAGVLVLVLALPPLLCAPADVAPVSAAMLTVSYALGVSTAVISGIVWDVTGVPAAAFVPIGLCALLLLTVPATIPFGKAH